MQQNWNVLSTHSVPESQRAAYWIDAICSTYVLLDCEPSDELPLFGDIQSSRLGILDFTHLRSNVKRVRRTERQINKGGDDYCMVQIQREGKSAVIQDGRTAVVNPGDFVLYESTRPYELILGESGHDVFVMRVPRAQLEAHVCNLEELTATTVSGGDAAGNLLSIIVETLVLDIDKLQPSSTVGVSDAITNVVAAGLRGLPGANVRKPSTLQAYHIARVKAYVLDNLRDPELTIHSVARAMKMSPDHLSRLFRAESVPLSRMIWRMRLEGCRRDLTDPRLAERGISHVAFSWGFNNATHFSRSFRDEYGVSPREWRDSNCQHATSSRSWKGQALRSEATA